MYFGHARYAPRITANVSGLGDGGAIETQKLILLLKFN